MKRFAWPLVMSVLTTSCAWVRHDMPPAALLAPERAELANDITLAQGEWPESQWWHRYADPALDALVARALADAPSLAVARARLQVADADVRRAGAAARPLVGGIAQGSRSHSDTSGKVGSFSLTTPLPVIGALDLGRDTTTGVAGAVASHGFDFFGMNRAVIAAAIGAEKARQAETAAIANELSAGVAELYFKLQATRAQEAIAREVVLIAADAVRGAEAGAARGLVAKADVAKARLEHAKAAQLAAAAASQARAVRESLRALIGAGAEHFPSLSTRELPEPAAGLPATLSYALLSHRADLVAMHRAVEASLHKVDAARAAFYPSFDIKAFLGVASVRLDDLARFTTRAAGVVPGVRLPLFDGGRLNANLARSRAESNELIARYNEAVLNAVRDVALAATGVAGLAEQARLDVLRLDALETQVDAAAARQRQGLISRSAAAQARVPLLEFQAERIERRYQQLAAEIKLTKALGGGYAAGDDVHAKSPDPRAW